MNQVKDCFEHIQVIRGVNKGLLTNDQLTHIIIRYQLSQNEKEELFELLKYHNIQPTSKEEILDKPVEETPKQKREEEQEISMEEVARRIACQEKLFIAIFRKIQKYPNLLNVYVEEFFSLKEAIIKYAQEYEYSDTIISFAIMDINIKRRINRRKKINKTGTGVICGFETEHERNKIIYCIHRLFSKDELTDLIQCCCEKEKKLTHQQIKMMLIFLSNILSNPQSLLKIKNEV